MRSRRAQTAPPLGSSRVDTAVWVPIVVSAIGATTGVLAYLGKRAERKDERGNRIVAGYDQLADDLRADLAAERAEVHRLRADNDRLRAELEKAWTARRGGGR